MIIYPLRSDQTLSTTIKNMIIYPYSPDIPLAILSFFILTAIFIPFLLLLTTAIIHALATSGPTFPLLLALLGMCMIYAYLLGTSYLLVGAVRARSREAKAKAKAKAKMQEEDEEQAGCVEGPESEAVELPVIRVEGVVDEERMTTREAGRAF